MGGVYGNMLAAFTELMVDYEVFKMRPRIGSGYGERYDKRTAAGYMSWRRGDRHEIQGNAPALESRGTFWERHDFQTNEPVVQHRDFVEIKGKLYRLMEDADFGYEGGFSKWDVITVSGVTDRQTANTKVDEVIRKDYE